jgi:hypothetical protein
MIFPPWQLAHRWRKDRHPTHRPRFIPHKYYFSASGTNFCRRMSKPQGLVQPEGLSKLKKSIHLIGFRSLDLPACSILPPWVDLRQLQFRVQKWSMQLFLDKRKCNLKPSSPCAEEFDGIDVKFELSTRKLLSHLLCRSPGFQVSALPYFRRTSTNEFETCRELPGLYS